MKVFISYSTRNRDAVQSLAKDLEGALNTVSPSTRNEVWFDQELVGGHDWWNSILEQLRNCDVFIFALSPNSIKSDACNRELTYAHDLQKRLLPIWVAGELNAIDMPAFLQSQQWINYTRQDKLAFQQLLTALTELPAATALPMPLPAAPDMPRSPLSEISHQLMADKLDRDLQIDIFYRLKEFLAQPDNARDAYRLLLRLRDHQDVRKSISEDIEALLNTMPGEPKATSEKPAVSSEQTAHVSAEQKVSLRSPAQPRSKWFGRNGRTIGLILGALIGIFYPLSIPTCGYVYGYYFCDNTFDPEFFVGSIVVFGGIGWGIDLLWKAVRKNNAS